MPARPIFQFYAELAEYRPKMWRRFQILSSVTMARFAFAVMAQFEMEGGHLFSVETIGENGMVFELPNPEFEDGFAGVPSVDANTIKLSRVVKEVGQQLVLTYDFGDNWEVLIKFEKIIEDKELPAKALPRVMEGAGFGIIEDCGGPYGLMQIAQALKDKSGPLYEEHCNHYCIDNFSLDLFDLAGMNRTLRHNARMVGDGYIRVE